TPPVRRHLKACDRCRTFRGELRATSRALAAIYPVGPLLILKQTLLAKLGAGGAAGGAAASSGAGATSLASSAAGLAGATSGLSAGGALSAGIGTVATKAVAGVAAAAIVTAG